MTSLVETPTPQLADLLTRAMPEAETSAPALARGSGRVMLASEPSAARRARAAVKRVLSGHAGAAVADALIVVSELVTNSVLHADQPPGGSVELRLHTSDGMLTIHVVDAGPGFEPSARGPVDFATPGGNGLPLVDLISLRWGVTRKPPGVWAQLAA